MNLIKQEIGQTDTLKDPHYYARLHSFQGWHFINLRLYDSAIASWETARTYFLKTGDLFKYHLSGLQIANYKGRLGVFDQSQAYLLPAVEYFRETGNTDRELSCLYNLSYAYYVSNDLPRMYSYTIELLRRSREEGKCYNEKNALNQLSSYYMELKMYDSCKYYISQMLELIPTCRSINNDAARASGLFQLANIESAQDSNFNTEPVLKEATDLFVKRNNYTWISYTYAIRAEYHFRIQNYQRALQLADTGYQTAVDHNLRKERRDNAIILSKIHYALGNYKEAYDFNKEYTEIKLKSNPGTAQSSLIEEEMKIAAEKERKIMELKREQEVAHERYQRNVYLGIGILVLLVSIGLWSRLRFVRKASRIIKKERDRSEELLLNILPHEIAEELKENGSTQAKHHDKVTILFTDFKQFTQTAEKLSAEELVEEVDLCFRNFDGICEKYHIEKIKTIGDSYMAVGGLPVSKADSAKRATLAALEMSAWIKNRCNERIAQAKIPFEMRVGINTGPVVAGIVGVKKFQYDIWGDTVNTASRMESNGEVGKVNISESTYALIKNEPEFRFEPRGKVEVKGKGEVEMYFVYQA